MHEGADGVPYAGSPSLDERCGGGHLNKRAAHRPFRISRPRYAAALLVAFCLNLVLQPCAMALDGRGECPDCPPDSDHGSLSHHADLQNAAAIGDPCATGNAGCAAAEGFSHEQRGGQPKLKDAPSEASAAVIETNVLIPESRRPVSPHVLRRTSLLPGAAPPLNVLYCVYLK